MPQWAINALPEHIEYRDEGCEVSPSCFECPLRRCKYDVPGGLPEIRRRELAEAISDARAQGETAAEVAERFGVSPRTVFRMRTKGTITDILARAEAAERQLGEARAEALAHNKACTAVNCGHAERALRALSDTGSEAAGKEPK